MNLNKHIWEGWTVKDFIDELNDIVEMIQNNDSHIEPFKTKEELKVWCMDNQPYYKKYIPEVVEYFAKKHNIN